MNATKLAEILGGKRTKSGFFYANCPAHDDHSERLTIFDIGDGRAEFICEKGCSKQAIEAGISRACGIPTPPDMTWIDDFKLTEVEVRQLIDPDWIYPNLIIQGHLIAIPAAPGAGKTTIIMYVAGQIAGEYQVIYVNADVGSGDVKAMQALADKKGFHLLLPDMKAGLSMDDVVNKVIAMNELNADYSRYIFIFDTLKKMTDVINKSKAKQLYKTLRGLTAKGMTIILLAHTNKYDDADGNPIYEGTGDLRSDVDDLIYLIPKRNEDGSMTVSTDPLSATAKRRGTHQPITFRIGTDRKVTALDAYIDVATIRQSELQREKDETVIEAVIESIEKGKTKQTEITSYCKDGYNIGWRTVERVLLRYSKQPDKLWNRAKGFQKNAWLYSLIQR